MQKQTKEKEGHEPTTQWPYQAKLILENQTDKTNTENRTASNPHLN